MKILGIHIIRASKLKALLEKTRAEQRRLNNRIMANLLRNQQGKAEK